MAETPKDREALKLMLYGEAMDYATNLGDAAYVVLAALAAHDLHIVPGKPTDEMLHEKTRAAFLGRSEWQAQVDASPYAPEKTP